MSSGFAPVAGGGTHRMNFPGGIDTSNTSYNVDHTGAPIRVGAVHQNRPSNPFAKN